jgi:hypothetical protein
MKKTEEQLENTDVFRDWLRTSSIEAGAGCGKTSQLVMLGQTPDAGRGVMIAFNKAVAVEAQSKFPSNVSCSTAHSLAFRGRCQPLLRAAPRRPAGAGQVARRGLPRHPQLVQRRPQGPQGRSRHGRSPPWPCRRCVGSATPTTTRCSPGTFPGSRASQESTRSPCASRCCRSPARSGTTCRRARGSPASSTTTT